MYNYKAAFHKQRYYIVPSVWKQNDSDKMLKKMSKKKKHRSAASENDIPNCRDLKRESCSDSDRSSKGKHAASSLSPLDGISQTGKYEPSEDDEFCDISMETASAILESSEVAPLPQKQRPKSEQLRRKLWNIFKIKEKDHTDNGSGGLKRVTGGKEIM